MAAFRGEDAKARAVPIHAGFAKASPGGDDRLISNRSPFDLIQRHHIAGLKG